MSAGSAEPDRSGPLFDALRAEFERHVARQRAEAQRDVLVFTQGQRNELGRIIGSTISSGGFCTVVVHAGATWEPRSVYYQALRFAAKNGKRIHCAFLLPLRGARHNATLKEHLRLDQEAGIDVSVLYVGRLIAAAPAPFAESLEISIWDDEVVCIATPAEPEAGGGGIEWRLSRRTEDLQASIGVRQLILKEAEDVTTASNDERFALDLEEPMLITAPIAAGLAPVLCQGDYVSPGDCSWYHSVWQYLRIFDMVSTPTWHEQFYLDALSRLAAEGGSDRILISGTADYSMLAHVLRAYRRAGRSPHVVVVDLCETPLLLCRWYGKYAGQRVEAIRGDIFQFTGEEPFDLIVSDAFLTRFDDRQSTQLLRKWADLLRQEGSAITTVRIGSNPRGATSKATPEQAEAFRKRALGEARKWRGFLDRSPEEIAEMAHSYAEQMTSHAVGSAVDLRGAFEAAGFAVHSQIAEVPGELVATDYARVIATKLSS
jgi:hypothetical protein